MEAEVGIEPAYTELQSVSIAFIINDLASYFRIGAEFLRLNNQAI